MAIGEANPVKVSCSLTNATRTPLLFETPYRPPQLSLWELNDEWLKVVRRPDYAPRAARQEPVAPPLLFAPAAG